MHYYLGKYPHQFYPVLQILLSCVILSRTNIEHSLLFIHCLTIFHNENLHPDDYGHRQFQIDTECSGDKLWPQATEREQVRSHRVTQKCCKMGMVIFPSNSACIMGLDMLKQMPNLGR